MLWLSLARELLQICVFISYFYKGLQTPLVHKTTQCIAVQLVRFYLIQCNVYVCTKARACMHAHIDTKHDTVSESTSRWPILLQVYNRNKHCLTRVSCLMKQHQSYRQKLLCIFYQVSATIFLHVFGCLHFEFHRHKLRNTVLMFLPEFLLFMHVCHALLYV